MMFIERKAMYNFNCKANVLMSTEAFFSFCSAHMIVSRADTQYFILDAVKQYADSYKTLTIGAYISLLFAQLSEVARLNGHIEAYLNELSKNISYENQKLAPYGAIICFDAETLYTLIAMHHRFIVLKQGLEYVSISQVVKNSPHDARTIEKKELMIKRMKRTKKQNTKSNKD
jgi:hypothetical protein